MEQFVTFDIAKKLNEKGFDCLCFCYYRVDNKKLCFNKYWGYEERINAPTISQVLKWLRDEKKLYIEPCVLSDTDTDADNKVVNEYTYWSFNITHIETGDIIHSEYKYINSYEEASIAGIEYTLNNLI